MDSEESGANLFRITQTEARLRRDSPQGLDERRPHPPYGEGPGFGGMMDRAVNALLPYGSHTPFSSTQ